MELMQIQQAIETKISELENYIAKLSKYGEEKDKTCAEYDKELSKVILRLRNNDLKEVNGIPCENLPVTLIEKVAKGAVWELRLSMDMAETKYKNLLSIIDGIKSALTGYQSINRFLKDM